MVILTKKRENKARVHRNINSGIIRMVREEFTEKAIFKIKTKRQ